MEITTVLDSAHQGKGPTGKISFVVLLLVGAVLGWVGLGWVGLGWVGIGFGVRGSMQGLTCAKTANWTSML
jgi:hypothetical protein